MGHKLFRCMNGFGCVRHFFYIIFSCNKNEHDNKDLLLITAPLIFETFSPPFAIVIIYLTLRMMFCMVFNAGHKFLLNNHENIRSIRVLYWYLCWSHPKLFPHDFIDFAIQT